MINDSIHDYVQRQWESSGRALTEENPMGKKSKSAIERQRIYTQGMHSAYEDVLRRIAELIAAAKET